MPSPLGHTLAGYAVARLLGATRPADVALALAAANVADADLAAEVTAGYGPEAHGGVTHSLGAALLCGLGAACLAPLAGRPAGRWAALAAAAYASHLALDYLGKTPEGSFGGLPLLWPLTGRRWASRRAFFGTIKRRVDRPGRLYPFLNRNNGRALRREAAVMLPVVLFAHVVSRAVSHAASQRGSRRRLRWWPQRRR